MHGGELAFRPQAASRDRRLGRPRPPSAAREERARRPPSQRRRAAASRPPCQAASSPRAGAAPPSRPSSRRSRSGPRRADTHAPRLAHTRQSPELRCTPLRDRAGCVACRAEQRRWRTATARQCGAAGGGDGHGRRARAGARGDGSIGEGRGGRRARPDRPRQGSAARTEDVTDNGGRPVQRPSAPERLHFASERRWVACPLPLRPSALPDTSHM